MESIGTIVPYLKSGFRYFVYVIVFFLIAAEALASDRPVTVKAMIVDARSGEALIGAAMLLEGAAEGAVTDIDGFCEIQLDKGTHVLSVSYIGYLSAKVSLEIDRSGYSLGSHEANVTRDGKKVSRIAARVAKRESGIRLRHREYGCQGNESERHFQCAGERC